MTLEEFRTKLYGMCGLATVEKAFDLYSELEAENERLKGELDKYKSKKNLIGCIVELEKENAKLKCLALHGMFGYACAKMNVLVEKHDYKFGSGKIHKDFSRWHRLCRLWLKAYRKAKKELTEGK